MLALVIAVLLSPQDAAKTLDAYLDRRWDAPASATEDVVQALKLDAAGVEKVLREGRSSIGEPPQPRGKLTGNLALPLEHVDHATKYFIYVPRSYDPKKAAPIVIVGHGGSSARDLDFGARAALGGMQPFWLDCAEKHGFLVLAPLSDRGWGAIGYSIVFSALSKVQREYRVDPDRVYITGHSMGGHLTWRSGIGLADRWGAVSPMSGGYDYVKDKQVYTLFNVPGYATYGKREPYQINEFNNIIRKWMEAHAYPWVNRECEGGHEIFPDEIEPVWKFFAERPRDLYRKRVYARAGGSLEYAKADANAQWRKEHTWTAGRPIPASTVHWLRLVPLPADTPPEKAVQSVWAVNKGDNSFEIVSENARRLRIYLHPKMVDFAKPVKVVANGKTAFEKRVAPDLRTMLELVREFDDRGRVFHAAIEFEVAGDGAVPEPTHK